MQKNEIVIYWKDAPLSLNALVPINNSEVHFDRMIFQRLFDIDYSSDTLCYVLNRITTNFKRTVFPIENKVTCRLRKDATWDNGEIISMDDAMCSLKIALCSTGIFEVENSSKQPLKFVEFNSDSNYMFTLCFDSSFKSDDFAHAQFFVLPEKEIDPNKILAKHEINYWIQHYDSLAQLPEVKKVLADALSPEKFYSGSGPYKVDAWKKDSLLVLSFKHNWWGSNYKFANCYFNNYPNKLIYHFNWKNDELEKILLEQKADVVEGLDSEIFRQLEKNSAITANYIFLDDDRINRCNIFSKRLGPRYHCNQFPGFWEPDFNLSVKTN